MAQMFDTLDSLSLECPSVAPGTPRHRHDWGRSEGPWSVPPRLHLACRHKSARRRELHGLWHFQGQAIQRVALPPEPANDGAPARPANTPTRNGGSSRAKREHRRSEGQVRWLFPKARERPCCFRVIGSPARGRGRTDHTLRDLQPYVCLRSQQPATHRTGRLQSCRQPRPATEHVRQIAVEAVGPKVTGVRGINELGVDPDPVLLSAHTSFKHITHPQVLGD